MIQSLQNPRIKKAIKLREGKHRRKIGLFILEGARELERARLSGIEIQEVFVCEPSLSSKSKLLLKSLEGVSLTYVSQEVYQKLVVRSSGELGGVCALAVPKIAPLEVFSTKEKALLIAVQSVEKPGNLGAILRTADAVGADGLVMLDSVTDLYSPQAIRASLGGIFNVPVAQCSSLEFMEFCNKWRVNILAASPDASKNYHQCDLTSGTALVFGPEDKGLSPDWDRVGERVSIPMRGVCDSLNLSVSVGILAYEARRQRSLT